MTKEELDYSEAAEDLSEEEKDAIIEEVFLKLKEAAEEVAYV